MRRLGVFLLLLLAFLVWTFPHRRVVERIVQRRLSGLPVTVTMGHVVPQLWPPGYRIGDVVFEAIGAKVTLDAVELGLWPGSRLSAKACGGSADATTSGGGLQMHFEDVDPSACINASVKLSGSFAGDLNLDGLGTGGAGSVLGRAARAGTLSLEGTSGTLSGYLPVAPGTPSADSMGKPIGTWEFQRAGLAARLDSGEVVVDEATAEAEGVRWELAQARLSQGPGSRTRVNAELRARRLDDSPRSKALLSLLPKATENAEGWRRYRISGTVDAPKVIGLK
jgi:type II secretion system protein N